MKNVKTAKEIASMMSLCIPCDNCKLNEKCKEIYGENKTETMCEHMWVDWLNGNIKVNIGI